MDYLHFKGTEEKSVINNIEVVIGLTEGGYYYAEFMYIKKDLAVGFKPIARSLLCNSYCLLKLSSMESTAVSSWVVLTPADSSIRLEAIVASESAYLS